MKTFSAKPPARRACLVILEQGAAWPARVFRGMGDRDAVIVVTREPNEPLGAFLARVGHRSEIVARHAFSVRTVILACRGQAGFESRLRLLQDVARQLVRERETRFVIVGDGSEPGSSRTLLLMAGALLEDLRGETVTVQVLAAAASLGKAAPLADAEPAAPPRLAGNAA